MQTKFSRTLLGGTYEQSQCVRCRKNEGEEGAPAFLSPIFRISSDPNHAPPACGGRGVGPWVRCGRKCPFPNCAALWRGNSRFGFCVAVVCSGVLLRRVFFDRSDPPWISRRWEWTVFNFASVFGGQVYFWMNVGCLGSRSFWSPVSGGQPPGSSRMK